jgi:hypothetical protein
MGRLLVRAASAAALCSLFSACATGGVPTQGVGTPRSVLEVPAGPQPGFAVTQDLTSRSLITWTGRTTEKGDFTEKREAGLRLAVRVEAAERAGNVVSFRAQILGTDILQYGAFVRAPFVMFNPPSRFAFSVDYAARSVDFAAVEKDFAAWAQRLKEVPSGEVLAASMDIPAYVAQLRELFSLTALEYAGRRYPPGEAITVRNSVAIPFLAPGLALGPFQGETAYVAAGQEKLGERELPLVRSTISGPATLSLEDLAARMRLLKSRPGVPSSSTGTFAGEGKALLDPASGWPLSSSASFTSTVSVRFKDGDLREEVRGTRQVEPRR